MKNMGNILIGLVLLGASIAIPFTLPINFFTICSMIFGIIMALAGLFGGNTQNDG